MHDSFSSNQTLQYNHASNGPVYGFSHQSHDSFGQAADYGDAAGNYVPMTRWLSQSRQDEPFHAFTLTANNTSGHDEDSLTMDSWLNQSRQDEPFSVYTMTNGYYSGDIVAGKDFDSSWPGYAEELEEEF
ncbi:hypothetical protein PG993_009729 [Apiospora rasikravindrae]|uniref:Uncharacterized protein n=1 Tax=Apiospora rasikravindrae TaxID=990691 RepID=A0ABR1SKE2_9PEZI